MKKSVFIFLLVLSSLIVNARDSFQVGVKIDPNISYNRLEYLDQNKPFDKIDKNLGLKLNFTLFADIKVIEAMDFRLGLALTHKNLKMDYTLSAQSSPTGKEYNQDLNVWLQYISLPVSIRLYTGEFIRKMTIYLELGGYFDVKIKERLVEEIQAEYQQYVDNTVTKFVDAGLFAGLGVEYRLGDSNAAFAGFEYNRGLLNVMSRSFFESAKAELSNKTLKAYNDQIRLVLGFKF